jgi:signal peptidase II
MEHIEARVPAAVRERSRQASRLRLFAAVAAIVVAVDQATKALIRGWLAEGEVWPADFDLLRLAHVENSGAAFGILQDAGVFLIASSIIGVAAVLLFLRSAPAEDHLYTAALALVLGGAVGNLIDRLFRGEVTDFIDPTHYPSFNLADSAIVVGVFALILLAMRPEAPGRG